MGSIAGACGAWLSGLAAELTGGFEAVLIAVTTLQLLAVLVIRWQRSAQSLDVRLVDAGANSLDQIDEERGLAIT